MCAAGCHRVIAPRRRGCRPLASSMPAPRLTGTAGRQRRASSGGTTRSGAAPASRGRARPPARQVLVVVADMPGRCRPRWLRPARCGAGAAHTRAPAGRFTRSPRRGWLRRGSASPPRCANPCGAGRQVLAQFISPGAVRCGRNAGPPWLTPCMPRPRRAAGASASSTIGTSMIVRSLVPGAPVAHALVVARRPLTGCACRLSQSRSGDGGAWSLSSRGISSSLVSFVNIANIDLRGSQA